MLEQAPIGGARLWSGVVLAPLAWLLAEGAGYVLVARACEPPIGVATNPETGPARVVDIAVCVVCLVVAALGLFMAIANTRVTLRRSDRPTLLSLGGAFSSAVFTAGILLFALPAAVVNACNQVR